MLRLLTQLDSLRVNYVLAEGYRMFLEMPFSNIFYSLQATMIDYMTSSSGGSDTLSNTTGLGAGTSTTSSSTRGSRVRTVRLVRPPCGGTLPPPGLTCRHGPGLGFSVRGGREHGTGFFVSQVEVGSEAHRQGLKVWFRSHTNKCNVIFHQIQLKTILISEDLLLFKRVLNY